MKHTAQAIVVAAALACPAALGSLAGCGAAHHPSGVGALATDTGDAARPGNSPDECFTGGEPDIIQARIALRERASGQVTSVVDLELDGPRRDAIRACWVALKREFDIGAISQGVLEPSVERHCSATAMPSRALDAPAVLVDTRSSDALTLIGIETVAAAPELACSHAPFERVRVTTRRRSAYRDRESCERARLLLEQAMQQAELDARQTALDWLERQLGVQQRQAEQACATEPPIPACERHKQLIKQLERRIQEIEHQPPQPPTGVTLVCQSAA